MREKGDSVAIENPAACWIRVIVLHLGAFFTSSCALGDLPPSDFTPLEESEIVNIVLKEWYVLPDKRTVDAGGVTFKVANQGRIDHEFIVIKTALPVHDLPVNEKGLNEKKAGLMMGEIEDIHPGEMKEITFNMFSGSYVLFCNRVEREDHEIISHYRKGMRVAFTVR